MSTKALIFKPGKWNNINFDTERVKNIFGNVKENVKGIFAHTSHWEKIEENPLELAEFNNFEVDSEGKVYANIEFNEKGLIYKQDNAIKGISVEIDKTTDTLKRIALLPIGVRPAVTGAEFEELEEDLIEFELIENEKTEGGQLMTLEEIQAAVEALPLEDRLAVIKTIGKSITEDQKKAFRSVQWEFEEKTPETVKEFAEFAGVEIEVKEKAKPKTEEEIRAEIVAEFEFKKKREDEKNKFLTENQTKIIPAVKEIIEFAYEEAQKQEDKIIEFSEEEKISMKEKIEKTFKGIEGAVINKVVDTNNEFEETPEQRYIREAKEMAK